MALIFPQPLPETLLTKILKESFFADLVRDLYYKSLKVQKKSNETKRRPNFESSGGQLKRCVI